MKCAVLTAVDTRVTDIVLTQKTLMRRVEQTSLSQLFFTETSSSSPPPSSSAYRRRQADTDSHSLNCSVLQSAPSCTGVTQYGTRVWFAEPDLVIPIVMTDESHGEFAASPPVQAGASVQCGFSPYAHPAEQRRLQRGAGLSPRISQSQPVKECHVLDEPCF